MASVDTRIRALEERSNRSPQDIVVIDEGDGPFILLIQGAESSQEFERQIAALRQEAAPGLQQAEVPDGVRQIGRA
jgi:hypothetical protein